MSRMSLLVPQTLQPVISTAGVQSCLTSVQSSSPSLLEPADGAGATRSERRPGSGDIQDVPPQTEKGRPVLSPKSSLSHSESIKWRQSLGLPTTDTKTFSRTPFQITSSKSSETASATPPFPSRVITPKSQNHVTFWSSVRTSRAPFSCSAETSVNTAFRSPDLNLLSSTRQHQRMSLAQNLALGNRSQCAI